MLSDSEIFNNMPEYTTKEILKRYGDVARQPDRHFGGVKPDAADMPPMRSDTNNSGGSRPSAPVITRVDTDPHQVNVQQNGMPGYPLSSQNTPTTQYAPQQQQQQYLPSAPSSQFPQNAPGGQQPYDFAARNSPYHQHGASNGSLDHMAQPRAKLDAYGYPSPGQSGGGGFAPS